MKNVITIIAILDILVTALSVGAQSGPAPAFGGMNFRGVAVALYSHSTAASVPNSSQTVDQFLPIFQQLASQGWGANGIRLVLHADPNQLSPNGTTVQHDHFFQWLDSNGNPLGENVTGSYDDGDRLAFDDTGFTKLITVLNDANECGLKVILDLHTWPGQTGYDFWSSSDPDPVTNTNPSVEPDADAKGVYFQQQYRSFWAQLIGHYLADADAANTVGDNLHPMDAVVGYDLMNEPDLVTSNPDETERTQIIAYMNAGTWPAHMPAAWKNNSDNNLNYNRLMNLTIQAVRKAEAKFTSATGRSVCNTAIVEGWGVYGDPVNFGWLQTVPDSMDNTVYSFHMYIPHFFTDYSQPGSYYPSSSPVFGQSQTEASMSPVQTFLAGNGVPANSVPANRIFVGELGTVSQTDNRGADDWIYDVLTYCNTYGWHWSWWSYDGNRNPALCADSTYTTSLRLPILEQFWVGEPPTSPPPPVQQ